MQGHAKTVVHPARLCLHRFGPSVTGAIIGSKHCYEHSSGNINNLGVERTHLKWGGVGESCVQAVLIE